MLLAVHPLALILTAIRPRRNTSQMLLQILTLFQSTLVDLDKITPSPLLKRQNDRVYVYLPVEGALAFFFIIDVVSFVLAAIGPLEKSGALHFVVVPHSLVLSPVRPVVNTYKQNCGLVTCILCYLCAIFDREQEIKRVYHQSWHIMKYLKFEKS